MKKRTLAQYTKMYRFAESRANIASAKMNFRASGLWHVQRLDIEEMALIAGYTSQEVLTGSEICR